MNTIEYCDGITTTNPMNILSLDSSKKQLKYFMDTYSFRGYVLNLKTFLDDFDTPDTIWNLVYFMGSKNLYEFIYANLNSKCLSDELTLLPVSFDNVEKGRLMGLAHMIYSFNGELHNYGLDFALNNLIREFRRTAYGLADICDTGDNSYKFIIRVSGEQLAHCLENVAMVGGISDLDYGKCFDENYERNSPQIKEWTKNVIDRDKQCLVCGETEKLEAHHINSFKNFPRQRIELTNGATLCRDCHKHYHRKYGYNNVNSHTWGLFMKKFGVR